LGRTEYAWLLEKDFETMRLVPVSGRSLRKCNLKVVCLSLARIVVRNGVMQSRASL
jgi:hypothetical protein